MYLLAEAASDENGRYRDGKPGDQKNGEELRIREISEPFENILRCPDEKNALLIAEDARKIAENDYGGYAQYGDAPYGDRYGLWDIIHGMPLPVDFSKITTPFNTDCSQLAGCCCYNRGYNVSKYIQSLKIKDQLAKFGFAAIPYSLAALKKGDILQRAGHVAVCIEAEEGDLMYSATLMSSKNEKEWSTGAGPKTRKTPYLTIKKANIGFAPGVIVAQQKGEILANTQWIRGQAYIYTANYENDAHAGVAVGKANTYFNPDAETITIPVRFPGKEYLVRIYQ